MKYMCKSLSEIYFVCLFLILQNMNICCFRYQNSKNMVENLNKIGSKVSNV